MFIIKIHVLVLGDGHDSSVFPAGSSISTISNLINELNQVFSHTELQFKFDPSTDLEEICCTTLNNDYPNSGKNDLTCAMARTCLAMKNRDKITLIFRDGANQVAPNFSSSTSYYVVLQKATMRLPNKLAHELGHYFHLLHTHLSEPSKATVEEAIRRYVEDEGHSKDEGLKALEKYDGDIINVKDTPYDLGAKIFGDSAHACASNAKIELEVKFNNPSLEKKIYTYIPQTRSNLMSYFAGCPFPHSFSNEQIKVIHNGLISGNRIRLLSGSQWDSSNEQDFISPAAVSRKHDTVAVFANNSFGTMMTKVWDASRGSYWPSDTGWFSLGGTGITSPVVISRRSDLLDLFARNIAGHVLNKVWSEARSAYYPGNQAWLDLLNDTASIDSKPAVISRRSHLVDIFVRWSDGTIRARTWNNQWSDSWENLGGEGVGSPAAVTRRADIIDLYARWSDGSIRSKVWRESNNSWYPNQTAWTYLGGKGYDAPAVIARQPNKIDLFIRWNDGTIRSKVWNDSRGSYWPGNVEWLNLGGEVSSEPVVVCRNSESITLFARWIDGSVRIKVWDDSRNSWWPSNMAWSNIGGDTIGRPCAVVRHETCIVVYARWSDNSIRSKVWNGETQQWWPGQRDWIAIGKP